MESKERILCWNEEGRECGSKRRMKTFKTRGEEGEEG